MANPTSFGDDGPDVEAWQRQLIRWHFDPGPVDGHHDQLTDAATAAWRASQLLPVGDATGPLAPPRHVPLGEAESCWVDRVLWDPGHGAGVRAEVALLVLHSAECDTRDGAADAVARYLVGAKGASSHYVVGPGLVVQSVRERHPAWTCGPKGNNLAIQIEMAGRAATTDWSSGEGLKVLRRCAGLGRDICQRWSIPLVALGPDEVKAGHRGVCTHATITAALGGTNHVDPGMPGDRRWPWELWLAAAGG